MDSEVHRILTTNWQILLLDEPSWKRYQTIYHAPTNTAFTDLANHKTFVRISVMGNDLSFILAHEAGHVACKCMSERQANNFATNHR
jgi:hypothetical protein